ncbi:MULTISPECIES: hypothetical protein [Haloarcula]|uniref:DUF7857 domain-containing protein n=1 Tax=Haloarcula TaxID=2237 RepID=UPI0023E7CA80|nr:hypothetical protein [Halomicroarcula sp. SHR3]
MVQVETDCRQVGEITLVEAAVTNNRSTPHTARLESTLDGPTWPPVRDGAVLPEWNDGVWETTIRPGATVGVGFATSAEPQIPAMEVTSLERVERGGESDRVASLQDWSPPRDTQPVDR